MRFEHFLAEKHIPTKTWEISNIITLYHGTTWSLCKKIKREGLIILDVKEKVNELLKFFNIKSNNIPNWITSEVNLRRKNRIYLSNNKQYAISYAKSMSIFGGEAATQTARKIMKYLGVDSDEMYKKLRPERLEFGYATIDIPRKDVEMHNQSSIQKVLYSYKKHLGKNWQKELAEENIEFYTEHPIPKKYIVRIDKI